ncbi:MAG: NAD(P)/FAD-dependent oxidoreductase [Terriglobales bacterium]
MQIYDAIVLGAGAAGLMCAAEAGKRGRRVLVLERAPQPGKKILISGGGRCNFTNLHCRPENFLSANPHFAKSVLARYTPQDFISLVEQHRIPYHEKTLGELFCDRSARDILDLLEGQCRRANVQIQTGIGVQHIGRATEFQVHTANQEFRSRTLVVATGGLSIPKMGATGFGYDLARQFGLKIQPTRPALVPLTLSGDDRKRWCDLAGVSTEVIASANSPAFREKMLFTHRGLSGPAILQASSYWTRGQPVIIDVAPERDLTASLRTPNARKHVASLRSALHTALPNRLADRWLENRTPKSWTNHALAEYDRDLHNWQVIPEGTEGYDKAEVTAGGIDTNELNPKTLESKKVPGLFFIGEVVDVTGHLGGFNFQWAWASAYCTAQAL